MNPSKQRCDDLLSEFLYMKSNFRTTFLMFHASCVPASGLVTHAAKVPQVSNMLRLFAGQTSFLMLWAINTHQGTSAGYAAGLDAWRLGCKTCKHWVAIQQLELSTNDHP